MGRFLELGLKWMDMQSIRSEMQNVSMGRFLELGLKSLSNINETG